MWRLPPNWGRRLHGRLAAFLDDHKYCLPPLFLRLHPASFSNFLIARFPVSLAWPNSCAAPSLPTRVPSPSFLRLASPQLWTVLVFSNVTDPPLQPRCCCLPACNEAAVLVIAVGSWVGEDGIRRPSVLTCTSLSTRIEFTHQPLRSSRDRSGLHRTLRSSP